MRLPAEPVFPVREQTIDDSARSSCFSALRFQRRLRRTLYRYEGRRDRSLPGPLKAPGLLGGADALFRVLEDTLTQARRFREPHVVTHGRPDGTRKVALQLLQDLGALAHPTVVERWDYAP